MKSKNNLLLLTLLTLILLIPKDSKAGAWPNEAGGYKNTIGSYYVAPTNSYIRTVLPDNVTFQNADLKIKRVGSRVAGTSEFSYGFDKKTTGYLKFDGGFNKEKYINTIVRNGVEQNVEIDLEYFLLDSSASILKQFIRTDYSVVSGQLTYYPGSLIFSEEGNLYNRKLQSYEMEVLIGNAFEANLGQVSKLFSAPQKKRWHYQEWKFSGRHFPRVGQMQLNASAELGLRPADDILAVFGFNATWNGLGFAKRAFNTKDISNFVDSTNLNASQKVELNDLYNGFKSDRSRFTDYQISAKISKSLTKNSEISLQAISNVIMGKPLKNSVAVISYEFKL